ncbi:multidrug effflux MFS transporter [Paenibacillus thermoaerophilus]|uniref:Bcr/CflA family efflux transporter n=1 Tax=Paenibacillus thermoaerophilus TaxID=1215385 RepID=A0ABW2V211_9BACL|nr:multidrug effflux MFS transporter [Paenibacillus thermoaerophilus]TMV14340.1 multidrug effflux MFS transporter [Paenibacillus thermoaerophilus]
MKTHSNSAAAGGAAIGRSHRLRLALILGSLSAFGPLSLDMYLPALPAMAGDLHTRASMVQLSLTACLLGLSLGQLFAGPISDVRGRRGPLLAGLAVYALTSLLCMIAPNIETLVALRFVQGAAGAAGIVLSRAIVRDLYSGSEMTRFFSTLMLINGAAPILAPIFGGQLLKFAPWPGVFLALALIGLAMLAAVWSGLPETLPADRRRRGGLRETFGTFRRLAADRLFIGVALTQGLVTAAMFAYISGSPFVLQNVHGVSEQTFSLIFAANGLGIIAAGQLAGRLAGRVPEQRLLLAGLTSAALGGFVLLGVTIAGGGLAFVLPALFLVVASVGMVSAAGTSLAMQRQGRSAGSASALLGVLSFVFGGAVSPLVGLGGSEADLPMAVAIAAAELGAIICYALLVRSHEAR